MLSLEETPINLIPDSIGELVHLSKLYLCKCKSLKKLPESIRRLVSLIELDISEFEINELPNSIGCLKSLKLLRMVYTPIRELPYTIGMAEKLEEINALGCMLLRSGLPMLPQSLTNLRIPFNIVDTVLDLSNLVKLKELRVDIHTHDSCSKKRREWSLVEIPSPWWIGRLSKVEKLDLAFPMISGLHSDVGALSVLAQLSLKNCYQLQSMPKLPSDLTKLEVINCRSLKKISDLSHLKKLSNVAVQSTSVIKLKGLRSLDGLQQLILDGCTFCEIDGMLENLKYLSISFCRKLERLPKMSKCKKLEDFILGACPNLVEICRRSESIKRLSILNCESLVKIPDILDVKTLDFSSIEFCPRLCQEDLHHGGPILTNNFPISENERTFFSTMSKICDYSKE